MPFFQGKHLRVLHLADDIAALVLDSADGKTNALNPAIVDELDAALDRIGSDGRFRQLVLCSGKPASFAYGPDLAWLTEHANAGDLRAFAERGQRVCAKLADLPMPSVAVIMGACLGAGLELALACDHRVVMQRPLALLGFTQIELGLMPCWGGTQRLPRLIGLENSLKLLAGARRLNPPEALRIGLVDAIVSAADAEPPALLAEPSKRDWSQRPRRNWRQRYLEASPLGRRLILRGARRVLTQRVPDEMPGPWEALAALTIAGEETDFAPGLEREREAIARLADSPAFANLLRLRLERERRRVARVDAARFVRAIGIVGATELGLALAEQALARGCQVVLHDADKAALGQAALRLHQALLQDEVQRGTLTAPAALKCLQYLRGTTDWDHFDELDLVLDTVEDGRRAERFRQLDDVTTPATILASTGAADTIASLRVGLKQPRRVAVVHFAGPPGQEPLVELAQPDEPVEAVLRRLEEWVTSLGRICLPMRDQPGLLVLRVWLPAFNEAALLLREGMQATRIDEALERFGIVPGPLEFMDRLGLDAVVRLIEALQPMFAGRITFEAGFAEMVRRGLSGAASGAGFYRHAGRQRRVNPAAVALWWAGPGGAPLARTGLSHAEQLALAQRRLTALMVIEAYHCLGERVVTDARTLDFALATAGWAPHRGGPIGYARRVGPEVFIAALDKLARDFGERFTPPAGLRALLAAESTGDADIA